MKLHARAVLGAGVLVALALGCASRGSAVPIRYAPEAHAPALPPVAAAQVKRYWALDWEKLPEGVSLAGRREAPTVVVEPGYPTPGDPNAILGMLAVGSDDLPGSKAEREAFFAGEVGKRGGNAYVEMPGRSNVAHLVVLHVSAAAPELDFPKAAALLAEPAPELATYQPAGDPVVRRLDDFAPLVIDGKRGSCYAVRAALDGSAALGRRARRALSLKTTSKGAIVEANHERAALDASIAVRTLVTVAGCPVADGPISVAFNVGFDSSHPDAGAAIGTGDVELQVFQRSIPTDDLDHRAAREATAQRENEDHQRAQFRKRECGSCAGQLAACPSGTDPASCQPFSECLFRQGMSVSDCF